LIEARDLYVNEALLTGEPYPVEKRAHGSEDAGAATPTNCVFKGSSVISGTARAVVVATGRATRIGAIAGALRKEPPPTAFSLGIRRFGMLLLRLTVSLVVFVLLVNLLFGPTAPRVGSIRARAGSRAHARILADDPYRDACSRRGAHGA